MQDTHLRPHLPTGEGLIPFSSLQQAIAGAEEIAANYERHSAAARTIAVDYFDSDKVLSRLLEEVDLKP
ncbi:MAG TPA: hypothetical protein VIL86_08265 [Tepidisphaeraceae bacterium]